MNEPLPVTSEESKKYLNHLCSSQIEMIDEALHELLAQRAPITRETDVAAIAFLGRDRPMD